MTIAIIAVACSSVLLLFTLAWAFIATSNLEKEEAELGIYWDGTMHRRVGE